MFGLYGFINNHGLSYDCIRIFLMPLTVLAFDVHLKKPFFHKI